MDLRPNTLFCIVLFLLVHYCYFCLYKGSLLYYITKLIQCTDFQSLTLTFSKYPELKDVIRTAFKFCFPDGVLLTIGLFLSTSGSTLCFSVQAKI